MKRLVMGAVVACAAVASAMPSRQEVSKAQPLVAELMAPIMDDFKAKKKTAAEVADAAVKYAGEAETEAVKFMLYRSSIPYYVRGEAYDKAADAVEQMRANVKGVPAEVVAEIISKATVRANREKAPRLFELYQQAKTQATAEKDVKELGKKPASAANKLKLAEALATAGDWPEALKVFANLRNEAAPMAKAELDGSAKSAALGEFWWTYKPTYENAEDTFKIHAAVHYRKALAAGEITGLKKNIVEQRIKEYGAVSAVAADGAGSAEAKRPVERELTFAGYLPRAKSLLLKGIALDEIREFAGTVAGSHVGNPEKAKGYVVGSGDGWKTVQFQLVRASELKCVQVRFEQGDGGVHGFVEKSLKARSNGVPLGSDINSVGKKWFTAYGDDQSGYGIKDLAVIVGGKGTAASAIVTTTTPAGSIELKTGGSSPFTVKGNEATLTLRSGVKLEFVKCPSGWVNLVDDYERGALRKVRITRPFWIMKQGLKKSDVVGTPVKFVVSANEFIAADPEQLLTFCSQATEDARAHLPKGYVIRMPSLAEWEYAYHAGDEDPRSDPFGTLLGHHSCFCNHDGNSPVNKWGLHDFHIDEKVLDRIEQTSARVFDDKKKRRIAKLPDSESNEDYFCWHENLDAAPPMVRCPGDGSLWMKSKGAKAGFSRLVIGPDLVSEWKAKHAKK